jgi:hypothetical protein
MKAGRKPDVRNGFRSRGPQRPQKADSMQGIWTAASAVARQNRRKCDFDEGLTLVTNVTIMPLKSTNDKAVRYSDGAHLQGET